MTEGDLAQFAVNKAGSAPAGQKCECSEHSANMQDAGLYVIGPDDGWILAPGEKEPPGTMTVFTRRQEDGTVCLWWWCEMCYESREPMALDEWIAEEGWPDDGTGQPEAPDRCLVTGAS